MFDPNKQGVPSVCWATYVPNRSPKFKAYTKRGHAIAALRNQAWYPPELKYRQQKISDDIKLYKLVDGSCKEIEFSRIFDSKGKIEVFE